VPGVAKVIVAYADKTAVVTFDDTKTGVAALITAPPMQATPPRSRADPG
jgi:copper chaperone CopZ